MRNPEPVSHGDAQSPNLAQLQPPLFRLAALILTIAAATILGAHAFERFGGYLPCPLCLMQRTPYYVGIPVMAAAALGVWLGAPRLVLVALFAMFAALMVYGAGLGAYHSGIEWGLWPGPESCEPAVGPATSLEDVLNRVQKTVAPSCTEATWRFLGLSFAGWNALVSALLAGLGLIGARLAWQRG